jgi:hypothetical protein
VTPAAPKPFPALLFWALLVPAAMFAVGAAMRLANSLAPWAVVSFIVPMATASVAAPIAIVLLFRGYATPANIILTLVGAIPVVTFLGMWFLHSLSHIHF